MAKEAAGVEVGRVGDAKPVLQASALPAHRVPGSPRCSGQPHRVPSATRRLTWTSRPDGVAPNVPLRRYRRAHPIGETEQITAAVCALLPTRIDHAARQLVPGLGKLPTLSQATAVSIVHARRAGYPVRACLLRADDAAGHARNPYRAVVLVRAGPGGDSFRDPLPGRLAGRPSAATASETCSLIISQYCAGESVTSSTPTSRSATSRSPAARYRALTYPGAAHRNIPGPPGAGGASTASAAMACMTIVVHGFSPGPAHTDEHRRPPGLSTRANSAVAAARSGKNMYPNRTEILSNAASPKGRSSALHTLVS